MILCDIGNTHLHFYENSKISTYTPQNLPPKLEGEVFFISVNTQHTQALLNICPQAQDIAPLIHLPTSYQGLGVDRKAACLGLGSKSGVVVDAGSAISLDIMENSQHLGGVLLPGLSAYQKAYKSIAPILDQPLDRDIDLEQLPQSTAQAVSFGTLQSVLLLLKKVIGDKQAYFTGGDGAFLARFFPKSVYDPLLVFTGMQRALKQ
ncbi:type III pantothenate kinase [Helicobacter felis]|uniref:type III pantothenate kinase n=1 Tax=Helicobacter felis TaxID=214 RepID=UPI000CF0BBE0|nr:type III pantothenate kinase [Helicobacter felis]